MNLLAVRFLAAEGKGPKLESHHWWMPEMKEVIWGGLALLVIYALLIKFLVPAAKKALADRTARIQSEVEGAKAARSEADTKLTEAKARLADADAEAARIIEQARRDAERLQADHRVRTQALVAETRAAGEAELAGAGSRAGGEVGQALATLSLGAAERAVVDSLDDAARVDLVEQFIATVGAARNGGN
jgi:F-type H+-transporting ATPase subunit b